AALLLHARSRARRRAAIDRAILLPIDPASSGWRSGNSSRRLHSPHRTIPCKSTPFAAAPPTPCPFPLCVPILADESGPKLAFPYRHLSDTPLRIQTPRET